MSETKAVFMDRDGVINPLVYNPVTQAHESPHNPCDFTIYPYVKESLELLRSSGYKIIVVSNQPSFAKGKATLENIKEIGRLLHEFSDENGGLIDEFYYCYHHPEGIVPEYAVACRCRKPGTLFPEQAMSKHGLDKSMCWFIGDSDTDIICGKAMGFRTVKISNAAPQGPLSKSDAARPGAARPGAATPDAARPGAATPDAFATDLLKAANEITSRK